VKSFNIYPPYKFKSFKPFKSLKPPP